ncbi:MAG: HAMP domain-containing histidine kinase [Saprospiraceae bacterium]|nr:HAMP domain-containing histidine kinase [Saprospiraceae bacterium]
MKKFNYGWWIIGASTVALTALIFFQLRWIKHSTELLEEQFSHRVDMALCSAVEQMADSKSCAEITNTCTTTDKKGGCQVKLDSIFRTEEGNTVLREALAFYKLDMPYEISVLEKPVEAPSPHTCSLSPIAEDEDHFLTIDFANEERFVLDRLGFMAYSSFAIILFIALVFVISSYYLIRQKRMSERNLDYFNHMTHEFRTPLTNIKLASKLLSKKQGLNGDSKYLNIIQQESAQLMEQVDRVLHLAKLEQEEYVLKKEQINAPQLVEKILREMSLQIARSEADVSYTQSPNLPPLLGDPFHLGNAIRNLLDNALKYSPKGARIEVILKKTQAGLLIRVRDNGPGISQAQQKRMFQKFQRGKHAKVTGQKGFGLGLAYVKKIIDLHQGQVNLVDSTQNGTCIDILLPHTQKLAYA